MTVRDLLLGENNDIVIDGDDLALVSDSEAVAQMADIALSTFAGEVFFDTTAGARWFDLLAVVGVSDAQFQAEVRHVLLLVPGIATVQNVTAQRDASKRTLTLSAQCTTDLGELLTVSTTTQV